MSAAWRRQLEAALDAAAETGVSPVVWASSSSVYGDAVSLRYLTVYGPRQRPDMAMRKLCEALLDGAPCPLYGDGAQSRDFTHVADTLDATFADDPAAVYNVTAAAGPPGARSSGCSRSSRSARP